MKILIAEDDPSLRENMQWMLELEGYEVQAAADGLQAFAYALQNKPDLVLTDVMMPRMDGFGLLEALRADTRTMHIPVVMLSARAGEEGMIEGLEAGADDYLIKPFTARELTARVAANLELDRARRMVDQARAAGAAAFVKQLDAGLLSLGPRGRAVKTLDLLPLGLRVREWPTPLPVAA